MFEITTTSNECRMAEATITFRDEVIGYVGGSSHESTCREAAEEVVKDALDEFFAPVIEKIKAHRDVDATSRFDWDDWDSH